MRRLILLLLASALATPSAAQHSGHHMPGMHMPAPKKKPAAKKPPAKKPVAKAPAVKKPAARKPAAKATKPVAKKAPAKAAKAVTRKKPAAASAKPKPTVRAKPKPQPVDPHAGHDTPSGTTDAHAGHDLPTQTADPHAGHDMPTQAADPHAGHQMPAGGDPHAGHGTTAPTPPVAPPPAEALSGPDHAADQHYGAAVMVAARENMRREHGALPASKLLVDRLEWRAHDGRDSYLFEGQGWYGGDIDKVWLKAEAEGERGRKPDHAKLQALWSHAIDPWFDVQAGVRFDPQSGPDRTHLVLGVQGLAPYWWEVDGALFLSTKGELTAHAEAEYDLRITQKLILQPRLEAELAAQDIRSLGIGSGLSSADLGVRLRYQVSPLFAPYVGASYERAFGATRAFRRREGEEPGNFSLVTGIRFWF